MQYKIEIDKKAVKFISKQPKNQQERIFKATPHNCEVIENMI